MELKNNLVIDFETFKSALTEILVEDSFTFRSIYPGSTANILVEALSGYAALLMYRLQTAITNSFLKTAFSEYSIFSIAEMLGVIIRGNTSSVVSLTLEREEFAGPIPLPVFTIPVHTSFTINGISFYNRNSFTFPSGYSKISVTLYQGEVKYKEYTTSGALNEKFVFGDSFTTDISYVKVYINGVEWKTDYETIMDYAVDGETAEEELRCVLLRTNVDGTSYVQFGNGVYGVVPPSGSLVRIVYISSAGSSGNFNGATEITVNDNLLFGDEILSVFSSDIGPASGGTDKLSSESLKYISPRLFASNNRAVKRSDYIGQMLYNCNYKDCNFWGEYEQAEKEGYASNSMMNRVFYTAITNDFSVKNVDIAVGDGETYDFTGNLSSVIMFPGSVEINSDNERFRDYTGTGYLFSLEDNYTVTRSTLLDSEDSIKSDSVGIFSIVKMFLSADDLTQKTFELKVANEEATLTPPLFQVELNDVKYYVVFNSVSSITFEKNATYNDINVYYKDFEDGEEKNIYLTNPEINVETISIIKQEIKNVLIDRDPETGLCRNADTFYQSSRAPTKTTPIIIEFKLPKDEVLSGIRLYSSSYSTAEDRCFPAKCLVVASRTSSPKKVLENYLSDNEERWTFAEMMNDSEWIHLTEAVNLAEPGVSSWSDWVGVNTVENSYKVKVYNNNLIEEEERFNKFDIYRLVILDHFGDPEQNCIKIGKIAFMCKKNSSVVNYETGNCSVKFLNAPLKDEVIKGTSIGDKLSDYQKVRDYAFLKKVNHFTTEISYKELKLKRFDIDVKVVYKSSCDLPTLKSSVEKAITEMFEVTQGRIGQSLRVSSLFSVIMGVDGVLYCTKSLPVSDVEVNVDEILYLSDLKIEYVSSSRLGE